MAWQYSKLGQRIFALLAISLVVVTVACTSKKSPVKSDLQAGIEAMDRGDHETAIFLFRQSLKQDLSNIKIRRLLAAAYVARAGIYLIDYVNLVEVIVEASELSETDFNLRSLRLLESLSGQAEDPQFKEILGLYTGLLKTIYTLDQLVVIFDNVPTLLGADAVNNINYALEILNGAGLAAYDLRGAPINFDRETSLYRALIRITLLNHDLNNNYSFSEFKTCEVFKNDLKAETSSLKSQMSYFLLDVANSMESEDSKNEIRRFAGEFEKGLDDALRHLSSPQLKLALNLAPLAHSLDKDCE